MMDLDSRENVRALIAAFDAERAKDPARRHLELGAEVASRAGVGPSELARAISVEFRFKELEQSLDLSGLSISHIRELRRLPPEAADTIDDLTRKAVVGSLSVRALRGLVDDSLRGKAAQAPTAREAALREAFDFEQTAYEFVKLNKGLFADARASLMKQSRGARIAVDFVLYDGTGLLVAFECKLSRKQPKIRQLVDLVGAHALFAREVKEVFTVFSAAEETFAQTYRDIVTDFGVDRQHTLMLDLAALSHGRCPYAIHRRTAEGWQRSDGDGSITQKV